jgi:hypothetical protein
MHRTMLLLVFSQHRMTRRCSYQLVTSCATDCQAGIGVLTVCQKACKGYAGARQCFVAGVLAAGPRSVHVSRCAQRRVCCGWLFSTRGAYTRRSS